MKALTAEDIVKALAEYIKIFSGEACLELEKRSILERNGELMCDVSETKNFIRFEGFNGSSSVIHKKRLKEFLKQKFDIS